MNIDHLTVAELIELRLRVNGRIRQLTEAENLERQRGEVQGFLRAWISTQRPPEPQEL